MNNKEYIIVDLSLVHYVFYRDFGIFSIEVECAKIFNSYEDAANIVFNYAISSATRHRQLKVFNKMSYIRNQKLKKLEKYASR